MTNACKRAQDKADYNSGQSGCQLRGFRTFRNDYRLQATYIYRLNENRNFDELIIKPPILMRSAASVRPKLSPLPQSRQNLIYPTPIPTFFTSEGRLAQLARAHGSHP